MDRWTLTTLNQRRAGRIHAASAEALQAAPAESLELVSASDLAARVAVIAKRPKLTVNVTVHSVRASLWPDDALAESITLVLFVVARAGQSPDAAADRASATERAADHALPSRPPRDAGATSPFWPWRCRR